MVLSPYSLEIDNISKQCEAHDRFLKELVRGHHAFLKNYLLGGLRFGVARRWNSWYPSYFDVAGGCYVLIPGDLDADNKDNERDSRTGVVVIDPGFKFIDILRVNYQIEPQDISTVIVTHFHPDHMAGLIEYATIMNTSKQSCNIYLNETTFATFKTLQNTYITVNELHDGQIQEIMRYTTRDKMYTRVTIKAVGVHHNELGNQHRSLGLILETTLAKSMVFKGDLIKYRIGILGDTDGNEEYIPAYVNNFQDVDILILHLGTFSDKKLGRGGKHLYIEGVKSVLEQMGAGLKRDNHHKRGDNGKKIIVLSEFGLELADDESLYSTLQPFIQSHSWRLPLIFTGLYLQNEDGESGQDGSSKKVSRFFAKAMLETIDKIQEMSKPTTSKTPQGLTRNETEELLVALTFQVLAFDRNLREMTSVLKDKLTTTITAKQKVQHLGGLTLEKYMGILHKELNDNTSLDELRTFYQDLVKSANFGRAPLSPDNLIESCNLLIEKIGCNLEHRGSLLYYLDKLGYISKYAEGRGLFDNSRDYRWAYGKGPGITDLDLFWTAGLIGIFLLRDVLKTVSLEPEPPQENSLIQIGSFFQKDIGTWANLLVGDIGCTFGLDPFSIPDNRMREAGIKLKSAEGKWISPYNAECFYDDENTRINYRVSQAKECA